MRGRRGRVVWTAVGGVNGSRRIAEDRVDALLDRVDDQLAEIPGVAVDLFRFVCVGIQVVERGVACAIESKGGGRARGTSQLCRAGICVGLESYEDEIAGFESGSDLIPRAGVDVGADCLALGQAFDELEAIRVKGVVDGGGRQIAYDEEGGAVGIGLLQGLGLGLSDQSRCHQEDQEAYAMERHTSGWPGAEWRVKWDRRGG